MTIEFYFDFISPNAYLAEKLLPARARAAGVAVRHVPVMISPLFKATGNETPLVTLAGVPAKMAYFRRDMVRFAERHGIGWRWNPYFPFSTLILMRGYLAAEEAGVADAYRAAAYAALWEQERKLDEAELVAEVLGAAGLDAPALLARADAPEIKERLKRNGAAAVAAGAFGLPSFVVGRELYFGKDTIDEAVEAAARAAA